MKHWTKEEDIVLQKAVSDLPDDFDRACAAASMLLENRTPAACRARWARIKNKKAYVYIGYARKKEPQQLEIPFVESKSFWSQLRKWFRNLIGK